MDTLSTETPAECHGEETEAGSHRPRGSISKPAKQLNQDQAAVSKQTPFCIPELVRAAFSSLVQLGHCCPLTTPADTTWGQGLRPLFPRPSLTHWHTRARVPAPLGVSIQICHFKAAACRPCLHGCNGAYKLKCWGAGKKKKEGNLNDSILEAYVLESLQPAPCQENIGQVGWSSLMQPQMVYASQFGSLL